MGIGWKRAVFLRFRASRSHWLREGFQKATRLKAPAINGLAEGRRSAQETNIALLNQGEELSGRRASHNVSGRTGSRANAPAPERVWHVCPPRMGRVLRGAPSFSQAIYGREQEPATPEISPAVFAPGCAARLDGEAKRKLLAVRR